MSPIKRDEYTDEEVLDYIERTYEPEELVSKIELTTEDLLDMYEDLVLQKKEEFMREMLE